MHVITLPRVLFPVLTLGFASLPVEARPKKPETILPQTEAGRELSSKYTAELESLIKEITAALPRPDQRRSQALEAARQNTLKATEAADAASKDLGKIGSGKALVAHAKGKWIGGAEKGIAESKAAIAQAKTPAEKAAAEKKLAEWEKNKKDGEAALKERQAALDEALRHEAKYKKAHDKAQAALAAAKEAEEQAASALLDSLGTALSSEKWDPVLCRAVILSHATPGGLARFVEEDPAHASLLAALMKDTTLMRDMLEAGGASHGQYGQAMKILSGIRTASPKAHSGEFARLALGVALEHAKPIEQSSPKASKAGTTFIDPVKRYLHYEKAYLNGELDPAFKSFTAWEYRHVVNCDAPDEILQWGRDMLRNYRPDHVLNPDYGWRYVSSVRTEVPYGSQNVHLDDPANHNYQNIIRNGGICGRRAFFGRFILRSFGIPTWGVTQKAHAALSHWTPKGWVVNLGAGYHASWWDKDEVPMSGLQFQMETQARARGEEYLKVLRAQWISRVLGETAYNDRRKIEGGFWSNVALQQSRLLAASAKDLGPLGQELGEANDKEQKIFSNELNLEDSRITQEGGVVSVPAVAYRKHSGKGANLRGLDGKMRLHALGGFSAQYDVDVPAEGRYSITARVATVQTGQVISLSTRGGAASETEVPYTLGMWQETPPVIVDLERGKNTLDFQLKEGSRGVTLSEIRLTPVQ